MANFSEFNLPDIKFDTPKDPVIDSSGNAAKTAASSFGTSTTRLKNTELQNALSNYEMMTIGGKEFFSKNKPLRDSLRDFYKEQYRSAVNIQTFALLDYIATRNPESMKTYSMSEDKIQNSKRNLVKFEWADSVMANKDSRTPDEVQAASAILWQGMSAYKVGEELMAQTGAAGQLAASEASMVQAGVYGSSASAGAGNSDIQAALEKVQEEEVFKWVDLYNKSTDPNKQEIIKEAMKVKLGDGVTTKLFGGNKGIQTN